MRTVADHDVDRTPQDAAALQAAAVTAAATSTVGIPFTPEWLRHPDGPVTAVLYAVAGGG